MLSTSIELGLDPAIVHWKRGWYSFGVNSSLRLNLSNVDAKGDENWRLSVGPGVYMGLTPRADDDKKNGYGPTFAAGIFFGSKSEQQTQLCGPELRVMYFPKSKETVYLLSFKYMWGFKNRSQSQ